MKIVYDKEILANNIKPNINLALKNLKEAYQIINTMTIPVNFSRKSDIESTKLALTNVEKTLNDYIIWIDNLVASLTNNDELIQSNIAKINVVDIVANEPLV